MATHTVDSRLGMAGRTQAGTEASTHRPPTGAPEAPVGRTTGWWGMVLFIATEATTFAVLIASYFYLRFSTESVWPPTADKPPHLVLPSIATGVLVLSCVPMLLSVRAARAGRGGASGTLTLLTLLAGSAFLVLQILDWLAEWPASTLSKDSYGSLLYSVTGLHTAHVVIGLGMLLFLVVAALVGRTREHPEPVGIVAMYWYFMAALAVAVYVTVYISPYL